MNVQPKEVQMMAVVPMDTESAALSQEDVDKP